MLFHETKFSNVVCIDWHLLLCFHGALGARQPQGSPAVSHSHPQELGKSGIQSAGVPGQQSNEEQEEHEGEGEGERGKGGGERGGKGEGA